MVALARFVLASLALLIIYIDPTEPDQLVEATYATLIGYVVFSGIIYWNARADRTIISPWLMAGTATPISAPCGGRW